MFTESQKNFLKEVENKSEIALKRWEKVIEAGGPIKDEWMKRTTALLMDNAFWDVLKWETRKRYGMLVEDVMSADIAKAPKIIVPLVRRVVPELLANKIVGVQPMPSPYSLAFSLRWVYQSTKGSVTAGDEAYVPGAKEPDTGYTGVVYNSWAPGTSYSAGDRVEPSSPNGYVYEAQNAGTSGTTEPTWPVTWGAEVDDNGITWKLVAISGHAYALEEGELLNQSGHDTISEGGFKIVQTTVTAMTRKIKSDWSIEAIQDIKAVHGLDVRKELIEFLTYEIQAEIDREIIRTIKALAMKNFATSFDYNNTDGRYRLEKLQNLYSEAINLANAVGARIKRGRANWMIVSTGVATAFEALKVFDSSTNPVATKGVNPTFAMGINDVGTIANGTIHVYVDLYSPIDYILVGYKGNKFYDTGVIYAPYVPITLYDAVHPDTMEPTVMLATRYGIITDLLDTEKYYGYMAVNNLPFTNPVNA